MQNKCSKLKCDLDIYRDEEYCVLHSENTTKDLGTFTTALSLSVQNYYTQTKIVRFDDIHFPLNFDLDKFIVSIVSKQPLGKLIIKSCVFRNDLCISKSNPKTIEIENNIGVNCQFQDLYVDGIFLLRNNTFESFEIHQSKIKQLTLLKTEAATSRKVKIDRFFIILSDIEALQISNQVFDTFHFAVSHFYGSFYANNIQVKNFLIRDSFFHENVSLIEIKASQTFYLQRCICLKPDLFTISNCDLVNSGFSGTDVSKINFVDNKWKRESNKKIVILDQLLAEKGEPYDNDFLPYIKVSAKGCAETYRQLKINYESKGNYIDAGDFHYGEMEMRRISEGSMLAKYFSIGAIYKVLSGYGEQPLRAIIVFLLSILLLAYFHLFSGFEIDGVRVNYDIQVSKFTNSLSLFDYLASIKLTFANLTLRNAEKLDMIQSNINTLLWIFETLFGPTQLALIVLSVKRKVKR